MSCIISAQIGLRDVAMAGQDNLNRFGTGILRLVAGWLLLSAAPVACFSTSKAPPSERTCESNCDRQVKAGCSQTEADFAATCKQACLAYRLDYPDCVSEMDTLSGCVEDKVRFSCDPTGALSKDPVAICMDQAYACAGCTGDFSACSN